MDLALKNGAPVIGLNDSGGRAHPGRRRVAGRLRRHLPAQHARLGRGTPDQRDFLGPCAGGAVYSPAINRLVFMVRGISYMFVTDRAW